MGLVYYIATLLVIIAGTVVCVLFFVRLRKIKRDGTQVSCVVIDCNAAYSTRIVKELFLDVTYEYDDTSYRAKCTIKRFNYYAPKPGDGIMLYRLPDTPYTLFPVKITEYPYFGFAIMMAILSLVFSAGLISALITIYA